MDAQLYSNLYRTHRSSNVTSESDNVSSIDPGVVQRGCAFASFASGGCPKLSDFTSATTAASRLLGYMQARPEQSCGELLGQLLECPSRIVLEEIESAGPGSSWKEGHLSKATGFLPQDLSHLGKLETIPGPSSWAILGKRMPGLLARSRFREAARQLSVSKADETALPDYCLHEAVLLLGILAYSFRYEQRITDDQDTIEDIPDGIMKPWIEVSDRLNRPDLFLGWQDYIALNATWKDVTRPFGDRWSLDNIQMFYPVFRTRTEHVFLMVMNEMLEKFTPAIEAMVKAQEAVILRDNDSLVAALLVIKAVLDLQIQVFHKIAANETTSSMYCDPVQWAKTTAQHTPAWREGVPGMSGLAAPMFHALDCFLGRVNYESELGVEGLFIRRFMPPAHQRFFEALSAVSVGHYCCMEADHSELKGLFHGCLEAYAGERGLLGTHRYKVYGFLELAFKSGRTETNGNTMTADDRGWEVVHDVLQKARIDRMQPWRHEYQDAALCPTIRGTFLECPFSAKIKERKIIDQDENGSTRQITIDLKGTGITYLPGDRLAVLPENSPLDVQDSLISLGISETSPIQLTADWKTLFHPKDTVDAIELLKVARIRPLPLSTVEVLSELCSQGYLIAKPELNGAIAEMKDIGSEQETDLTLGQLIEVVTDVNILEYHPDILCRLLQIERPRTYSISSTPESKSGAPESVELTVSRKERELSSGEKIVGIGSGFLNPPMDADIFENGTSMRIGISRPLLFKMPSFPGQPIVMFAGGSGIAPLRAFLQHRIKDPLAGENYLFLGVKDSSSFIYEKELADLVTSGKLHLDVAFSREDVRIDGVDEDSMTFKMVPSTRCYVGEVMRRKINSDKLWQLMLPTNVGGLGAYFYVCGSIDILQTVISALEDVTEANGLMKNEVLKDMFAHYRILSEVYKTPTKTNKNNQIAYSELAKHNNAKDGFWMVISKKVYDLTKFVNFHPSGTAIIRANSGIDATHAFEQVAHDTNAEIVSLMDSYEIGVLLPVNFESPDAERMYNYLLQFLTRVVEMENTYQFDAASTIRTEYADARDLMDTRYLNDKLSLHRRVLLTMASAIGGGELQLLMTEFKGLIASRGTHEDSVIRVPNDTYTSLLKTHSGRCSLHTLHIFKYLSLSKDRENPIHRRAELSAYIHSLMEEGQKFLYDVKIAIAGALAKLETSPSDSELKPATAEILGHLGSVINIIKKYLSNLKQILANRYVLKEKRTAKMLWEQLRIRFEERCLILLARPPVLHEIVHEALTAADALNEYAREMTLRLAALSSGAQLRNRTRRSLGLAGSISRISFNDGHAESKQLARIVQSINQLGTTSKDPASYSSKLLATEYIKSFLITEHTAFGAKHGNIDMIPEEDENGEDVIVPEKIEDIVCYEVYIQEKCGFSNDAIKLLRSENVKIRAIDVTHNQPLRELISSRSHSRQFPQVYVGSKFIGGLAELQSLQKAGLLSRLHQVGDGSTQLKRITKMDVEKSLTCDNLPDYVVNALEFLKGLFEESPETVSTSFDEFRYFYLGKENVEENKGVPLRRKRLGSMKRRSGPLSK